MLVVYICTISVGAGPVFLIQPMVAKMVLPLLGGSPRQASGGMVAFDAGGERRIAFFCLGICESAASKIVLNDPAPVREGSLFPLRGKQCR